MKFTDLTDACFPRHEYSKNVTVQTIILTVTHDDTYDEIPMNLSFVFHRSNNLTNFTNTHSKLVQQRVVLCVPWLSDTENLAVTSIR